MDLQQIISLIKYGQNPQALTMDLIKQKLGNSPMAQNLLNLAQKGDAQGLEQIARNICVSRGLDYDTEFTNFKNNLGL